MIKNTYSVQWIQDTLCFSGQAQIAQNSWMQEVYLIQWKFSGQLCFFRASASCSKILNDKNTYSIQLNTPGQLCFSRASASCSKFLNIKSMFHTVKIFRVTMFFRGALVPQKSWMIKNTYSVQWIIPGQLCFFRASASCLKILNDKKYIFSTVNSGHPLFFRASASCSKLLNVRSVFNTMNWATLYFRASAVAQKSWMVKNTFNTVKIFRETLFSGQGRAVKNPECKKYIQYSGNFRATLFLQGKRKLFEGRERWRNCQYFIFTWGWSV